MWKYCQYLAFQIKSYVVSRAIFYIYGWFAGAGIIWRYVIDIVRCDPLVNDYFFLVFKL
jgi:hypothetical protein